MGEPPVKVVRSAVRDALATADDAELEYDLRRALQYLDLLEDRPVGTDRRRDHSN